MSTCPHPKCNRTPKSGQLACYEHWMQLPPPLRAAINDTWRKRASGGLTAYSANVLEARRIWAEQVKKAEVR